MTIKTCLHFLLVSLICFATTIPSSFAQTNSNDLWLSTSFKYEAFKNFDVKVELGHRRQGNQPSRLYGDLILKYKLNKYAKLGFGWRHAAENETYDLYELSDRFHAEITGKIKVQKLNLLYRARYQQKYSNYFTSELGNLPNKSFRTRLLVGYKLNKDWSFNLGGETFLQFTYEEPSYIDRLRYIAEVNYRIDKAQSISLSCIRQQEVQVRNPHSSWIASIDYAVDVNRVLKKVKKNRKKKRKNEE